MRRGKIIYHLIAGMVFVTVLAGCSMIDEDMSDCGEDLSLDYDLQLVTNVSIELQTELDLRNDARLIKALREYLSPVFTDYAHDLDLSFYDTQGEYPRLFHEQHIMDANELSFTVYLPRRQYQNLAVTNMERNGVVTLEGSDFWRSAQLVQLQNDTVTPHKTGIFTARQNILLEEGVSKTYFIHTYMANCGAALVLDTSEASLKDLKVVATGFASRFNIADSTYVFAETPPLVLADKINTGGSGQQCYCTINFPSPEPESVNTRDVIVTEEPFVSVDAKESLWQLHVYATMADGSVTKSVLGVSKPLRAGQFKILHAHMYYDGGLEPEEPEVGVSVTLDWKEGNVYHPEL